MSIVQTPQRNIVKIKRMIPTSGEITTEHVKKPDPIYYEEKIPASSLFASGAIKPGLKTVEETTASK